MKIPSKSSAARDSMNVMEREVAAVPQLPRQGAARQPIPRKEHTADHAQAVQLDSKNKSMDRFELNWNCIPIRLALDQKIDTTHSFLRLILLVQ
jgi:hypothetical protein